MSRPTLASLSPSTSGDEQSPRLDALELNFSSVSTDSNSHCERKLGDGELSYYLPGRAAGVNDMYLHIGLKAPERLVHRARVLSAWTILRLRHPLLASRVIMHGYDDVRFRYAPPLSPSEAERQAAEHLSWQYQSKEELIDEYLNGPRTLSDERLSYLIVSQTPSLDPYPSPPLTPNLDSSNSELSLLPDERTRNFELFICAAHFIGDGTSLHAFANDFFGLVGGPMSDQELQDLMVREWQYASDVDAIAIPANFEEGLPIPASGLRRAAERVDFDNLLRKQIGGQAFPRRKDPLRRTVVPTFSFDELTTKTALKKCKAENVSIAAAVFSICNIAWARMISANHREPMMMYAAMNIRPYLVPRPMNDYWYLAVGYFNVVLPSTLPSGCTEAKTFWNRARSAKSQIIHAAKTPMLQSRCRQMSLKRGAQSRAWAREDDEKLNGTWTSLPQPSQPPAESEASPTKAPSTALLGLSMLGNLDAVYKHADFPELKLHTLTTGSRQRHGAMLLFAYTFAGRLWVSLGYDKNGFEEKSVNLFWDNMLSAMQEFLL